MVPVNANEQLLQQHCMGCHVPENFKPLTLSRISHQRKTPEGWLMTIARMQVMHGLKITEDNRRLLVKHLADTQGLTPGESQPYRYILERRLNHVEQKQPQLAEMCARCHSEARIGLQRRDEQEWRHLVHFHLGQWPSVEFSAMGRDRDWFGIALKDVVPFLGEKYSLDADSWKDWQQASKLPVTGRWRVVGNMPGKGQFHGVITLKESNTDSGMDSYPMVFRGQFANGESLKGDGEVVLYSGYEWRGSLKVGEQRYKQVFALNENGTAVEGRMFQSDHEALGIDLRGVRGDDSALLALSPGYLQSGEEKVISIRGANLKGPVVLGGGLKILTELSRSGDEIVVKVRAPKAVTAFTTSATVGDLKLDNALTVYDRISEIKVQPSYAVARVGDGGGSQGKVKAAYQALGYAAGKDGKAGTDDDIYVGVLPATWSVSPFDEQAVADRDVEFAGTMDGKTGVFTPGEAGPNQARKYGTNNAGHLSVIAEVTDDERSITGTAELMVTVQRWNNPPIR